MSNAAKWIVTLLGFWLVVLGIGVGGIGVVGFISETGPIKLVLGMLAVGGGGMAIGGVQMIRKTRERARREAADARALARASTPLSPAGAPPAASNPARPNGTADPTAATGSAPATTPDAVHGSVDPTADGDAQVELLAHWTYPRGEWRRFANLELRYRRREALLVGAGVVVLGTLTLIWGEGADPALAVGISATIASIIGGIRYLRARSAWKANAARAEVRIGRNSVLVNGRYQVLNDEMFTLTGATLEGDPLLLELTVEWETRSGRTNEQIRIPVPADRHEEAEAVMKRLLSGR